METTILAADIQPGDRFVGGQVAWILVGTRTVTVRFDDGQTAYYDMTAGSPVDAVHVPGAWAPREIVFDTSLGMA